MNEKVRERFDAWVKGWRLPRNNIRLDEVLGSALDKTHNGGINQTLVTVDADTLLELVLRAEQSAKDDKE